MPPQQCPECGRFLAAAFVTAVADAPAPCPKCEVPLTAVGGSPVVLDDGPAPDPATGPEPTPDPDPDTGPGPGAEAGTPGRDPLAGWDEGPEPTPQDELPFDPAAVAPYALVGLVAGALLGGSGRRGRAGLLGALLGLLVGVLSGDR